MSPVHADFVTRLDVDDFARHGGLEARFAGDVCVVDVGDGVVGGGDADADRLAVILAVDAIGVLVYGWFWFGLGVNLGKDGTDRTR
jgi:hypothetical protein